MFEFLSVGKAANIIKKTHNLEPLKIARDCYVFDYLSGRIHLAAYYGIIFVYFTFNKSINTSSISKRQKNELLSFINDLNSLNNYNIGFYLDGNSVCAKGIFVPPEVNVDLLVLTFNVLKENLDLMDSQGQMDELNSILSEMR